MEESLGPLSQSTPSLANKLITVVLDPKFKEDIAVSKIFKTFNIIQNGIIDR